MASIIERIPTIICSLVLIGVLTAVYTYVGFLVGLAVSILLFIFCSKGEKPEL